MAFTSAAISAVNNHLKSTVLAQFNLNSLEYDPTNTFASEIRQNVAEYAGKVFKKYGNRKWVMGSYSRTPLRYLTKKVPSVLRLDELGIPQAEYWMRNVFCDLNYMFVSPSPETLENLEELILGCDPARVLPAIVTLDNKFDWPFDVNISHFEVNGWSHLGRHEEGLFTMLQFKIEMNYPIVVFKASFGTGPGHKHWIEHINASVYVGMPDPEPNVLDKVIVIDAPPLGP